VPARTYRVAHANRAYIGIGLITILVGAAAESFASSQKLHMGLDADDSLVCDLWFKCLQFMLNPHLQDC
jgi:hypothetical protein